MPSSLRNPKTLSDWLELDYFRRRRALARLWWAAILAALLGSGAYVAWALARPHTAFQAGPVSSAHSLFNHDCGQCHVGTFQTAARLFSGDPAVRSVPDSACTKCHSGEVHHDTAVGERACASCHKEHRGWQALVCVDDSHCTSCHADLKRNDGKQPQYDPHITAFAPGKHPEVRLWAKGKPVDPGTIAFNHAVHLNPKGVMNIDWKQIDRQKKQAGKLGAHVLLDVSRKEKRLEKLECQSCHQPDEAGRFMLPINFDQHCKRCHPLSVQLMGPWTDEKTLALARTFSDHPAPHPAPRESTEVVRGVLRDRLAQFIQKKDNSAAFLGAVLADPPRRIPGSRRALPLTREQHAWVNGQLDGVERLLFDGVGGCKKCHQEKGDAHRRPGGLPEYLLPDIPARWLKHAVFKHKSHRMLDCAQCHPAAGSKETSDVLLPKIETCFECHSKQDRRARSDCVECHQYHDPSKRHDFRGELTIEKTPRR
jgi:hypothetical protein